MVAGLTAELLMTATARVLPGPFANESVLVIGQLSRRTSTPAFAKARASVNVMGLDDDEIAGDRDFESFCRGDQFRNTTHRRDRLLPLDFAQRIELSSRVILVVG